MKLILFALAVSAAGQLSAHDSIPLKISGREFEACDTISFEWSGHGIGKAYKLATLHVWIEDLATNERWKYRYPIVNGSAEGSLEVSKSIDTGTYAFTFMGSDMFLDMKGQVKNMRYKTSYNYKTNKQDTVITYEMPGKIGEDIRYTLISSKGILLNDFLKIGAQGEYRLPPVIFGDTANLIFDIGKNKNRYWVFLQTPIDSSFTPFYTQTLFVRINKDGAFPSFRDTADYVFNLVDPYPNYITLREVTVKGLTKAQRYEKEHVSGLFKRGIDVRTFDGIESDEIARSIDVFTFLQARVAGLQINYSGPNRYFSWRNDPVEIFVDEMPWRGGDLSFIRTSEIAMIKVYSPPAMLSPFNSGGAVAIFTKKGYNDGLARSRFSFEVVGYTQGEAEWKR